MTTTPVRRQWTHSLMDAIVWIALMFAAIPALPVVLGFLV